MSTHRSSSMYKVKNKPFKGQGHGRSKGAVRRQADGRPAPPAGAGVKARGGAASKAAVRAARARALRDRREAARAAARTARAPRLALLVALGPGAAPLALASALARAAVDTRPLQAGRPVTLPGGGRRRRPLTLLVVAPDQLFALLEAALVADLLVPVVDAAAGVDEQGQRLASAIKAQGLPAVLPMVTGMSALPAKTRHAAKKGLLADLQYLFPTAARLLPADESPDDIAQIFRFLDETRLHDLHYRQPRSFVLAESVAFQPKPVLQQGANPSDSDEPMGTLHVTGHVRGGNGMSADVLVHVAGLGDFQIDRILDGNDPSKVLHVATDARPPLQAENDPDPFAGGEQTWPTESDVVMAGMSDEELDDEEGDGRGGASQKNEGPAARQRVVRRRVPAGMNEYEAAWLVDSEEEEDDGEDAGNVEGEAVMDQSDDDVRKDVEDDPEGAAGLDLMLDDDDDMLQSMRDREDDERYYPDHVEAPVDQPARERFARYRGLDSFRTSVWDPKESLPADYSRIFQLEHFAHFVRRNTRVVIDDVEPGTFVTLELTVPMAVAQKLQPTRPLVLSSLLKHENKISVLHFDIMKHPEYHDPLPSKEELVAVFGSHRLRVPPIFSQHVGGAGRAKFERFLPSEGATMASFYGPITYSPCSISFYKLQEDGSTPVLVASGTLRSADADMLLIKKIVLTAHPAKVHKRTAMCKGMFHYPDDVKWFKPVALWTKEGRLGHIRESNGTKGDFKATFDGILNNSDTVCLSLYKRVFPRWQFENHWEQ